MDFLHAVREIDLRLMTYKVTWQIIHNEIKSKIFYFN